MKLLSDAHLLNENTLITFDGELSPKQGWAIFLAGGAGSGKGVVYNNILNLQAKYSNVDDWKSYVLPRKDELFRPKINGKYGQFKLIPLDDGVKIILPFIVNIDGEMTKSIMIPAEVVPNGVSDITLNNKKLVGYLHELVGTMADDWEKLMTMFGDYDKQEKDIYLPNLIFDKTMKKMKNYEKVKELKQYGYKICIVYVLTTFETARMRNLNRARVVKDEILLSTHEGALKTLFELENRQDILDNIDDIWIVLSEDININKNDKLVKQGWYFTKDEVKEKIIKPIIADIEKDETKWKNDELSKLRNKNFTKKQLESEVNKRWLVYYNKELIDRLENEKEKETEELLQRLEMGNIKDDEPIYRTNYGYETKYVPTTIIGDNVFSVFDKSTHTINWNKASLSSKYIGNTTNPKRNIEGSMITDKEGKELIIKGIGDYIKYLKNVSLEQIDQFKTEKSNLKTESLDYYIDDIETKLFDF